MTNELMVTLNATRPDTDESVIFELVQIMPQSHVIEILPQITRSMTGWIQQIEDVSTPLAGLQILCVAIELPDFELPDNWEFDPDDWEITEHIIDDNDDDGDDDV